MCLLGILWQVDETKAVQALGPQAALSQGSIEAPHAVAKAQLAAGKLVDAVGTVWAGACSF